MFQVIYTLPQSTYKDWLTFAACVRFIGQHSQTVSRDAATTMLTNTISGIFQHDSKKFAETLSGLSPHLEAAHNEPVPPEVFAVATLYRALEFLEKSLDPEFFLGTMLTIAHIIAVSYAKKYPQVLIDLTEEFEAMDKQFMEFRKHSREETDFTSHIPTSNLVH